MDALDGDKTGRMGQMARDWAQLGTDGTPGEAAKQSIEMLLTQLTHILKMGGA